MKCQTKKCITIISELANGGRLCLNCKEKKIKTDIENLNKREERKYLKRLIKGIQVTNWYTVKSRLNHEYDSLPKKVLRDRVYKGKKQYAIFRVA